MFVIKRAGTHELVQFDKITTRIERLCTMEPTLTIDLDPTIITQKVVAQFESEMHTYDIDNLAACESAALSTTHPDYGRLSARLLISNLHKLTSESFSETFCSIHAVNPELKQFVLRNATRLDAAIHHMLDYKYDYFGMRTLLKGYLRRNKDMKYPLERPQYMLMRVAVELWARAYRTDDECVCAVIDMYNVLSEHKYTHATPTLYNAGSPNPQLSSCYLLDMIADSIDGIFKTLVRCANISRGAGGIGVSITKIRATNSFIYGTEGRSNGLSPMCRLFNETARYVDQGGGKRKGSFALYLEPWHADLFSFLDLRKNSGKEELRARDIFTALWIPDLFMKRVEKFEDWSFFCPNEAPGLPEVWGEEFEVLYTQYEREGRARFTRPAVDVLRYIVHAQIETGTPYILYKDQCNRTSNHNHLGTIHSSNLCCEVILRTSPEITSVCNLASINLPAHVVNGQFDWRDFETTVKKVVFNMNQLLDVCVPSIASAQRANEADRPLGIGVQGLAKVFQLMNMAYESEEARVLNREIAEGLYYAALTASCELAQRDGTYSTYAGSLVSRGILHMDHYPEAKLSGRWNWQSLRDNIAQYGLRNSVLVSWMPTASTSQMLGNPESFEPYNDNIFQRKVLAGYITVVNDTLVRELLELGLWSTTMKDSIIRNNGSIQSIDAIPYEVRLKYKTVREIRLRDLIDMAVERQWFIDQSQSFNIYRVASDESSSKPADFENKLMSAYIYGWKHGLKTGCYYLTTESPTKPVQFSVVPAAVAAGQCSRDAARRGCTSCDG